MLRNWLTRTIAAVSVAALTFSPTLASAEVPATWDGLALVKSRSLDAVYLSPDANFGAYTKVMFDPTEVALKKNWLRDYNSSTRGLGARISQDDVDAAFGKIQAEFVESFTKAYSDAGFQVVTAPGPDVLRVRTAVINLSVNAPDKMTAGRSRAYAREAGEATLVLEARDSLSGAILGRAVDRRLAGDTPMLLRNSITNKRDFSLLFANWAKESARGLTELKAASPVVASAAPAGN